MEHNYTVLKVSTGSIKMQNRPWHRSADLLLKQTFIFEPM